MCIIRCRLYIRLSTKSFTNKIVVGKIIKVVDDYDFRLIFKMLKYSLSCEPRVAINKYNFKCIQIVFYNELNPFGTSFYTIYIVCLYILERVTVVFKICVLIHPF